MMEIETLRPQWPAQPRVQALCSTRLGGVSTGSWSSLNLGIRCGDEAGAVSENRRHLVDALQLPAEPCWLQQVHGITVISLPAVGIEPQADASFTTQPGVVCAVLTADCLPVLLCDDSATVVAAAHAGWRGLAAGVLESTVKALPVAASELMAWLGPAIGPEAFEVGDQVRDAFIAADAAAQGAFVPSHRPGHWYADLFALARQRLRHIGVSRCFGDDLSTHADARRFFSHRRDRVTGRQAAMIWLKP